MQSSTVLPNEYEFRSELDLAKNKILTIVLNVSALLLLVVFGAIFTQLTLILRPDLNDMSGLINSLVGIEPGGFIVLMLGLLILQVLVHELMHGLFFWLFTKSRPRYGFKGLYAYAAAPDWYIPRNRYIVVGLAPIAGMTLAGLLITPFVPAMLVLPILFILTINAAGSVGDLYLVGWLIFKPATSLVRDEGVAVALFQPASR